MRQFKTFLINVILFFNLFLNKRKNDINLPRVGVYSYGWALNIHIVNMINAFVERGFSVDLFLKSSILKREKYLKLINNQCRIIDFSIAKNFLCNSHPKSIEQAPLIRKIQKMNFDLFVGIEKGGIIWADMCRGDKNIPTVYYSLELYVEDHPLYGVSPIITKEIRDLEKYAHSRSVATIIQDKSRYEVLKEFNEVENQMILLPVSIKGSVHKQKTNYLQNKLNILDSCKIILSFGIISEARKSFEIADIMKNNDSFKTVFHGFFGKKSEKKMTGKYVGSNVFFSTDLVDEENIDELISSAYIGLVIYSNDYSNDRLTALSSEKIARYAKCGIPVITMKNESYEFVFSECKFGEMVESIDEIPEKIKVISEEYEKYREKAFEAFELFYNYEKNFGNVSDIICKLVKKDG